MYNFLIVQTVNVLLLANNNMSRTNNIKTK